MGGQLENNNGIIKAQTSDFWIEWNLAGLHMP